ncbi:hypothetical protein [Bordetella trematum]|uniref:hypothetical protein n=1 Tax=Bordetella trematum TaxID=123899 RepID=UPI003AF35D0C
MTAHDLEAKQADVALDPMAGTMAALNPQQGTFPAAGGTNGGGLAHTLRGDALGAVKGDFDRGSNLARAHVSPDADPWARAGAEIPRATPEARVNAGFDPGAGAGPAPALNVNILALDLGTKTGYALRRRDGTLRYGAEVFTPRSSWTPGQKWQRYRAWLSKIIAEEAVNLIVFEDVKAHGKGAVLAAHAYGGFRAMLEMVADGHRVRLLPVGVSTIKKHWTGKGNANKDAMLAQAKARGFRPETDNDADALAILHWAVEQEAGR